MISPRYAAQQLGFKPFIARVSKGRQVNITNTSENIWTLKKDLHLADVRKVISSDEATISKLFTPNISDFQPVKERDHKLNCFTSDVVIDPDKLMEDSWKYSFKKLCDEYTDIIQYTPGIYNGRFGFIQNTVEFTNIPPPNSKCYVPKYNKEQMDLLADQMDELLELGVLAKPEDVGVTPLFTSPSMLVPKPDPGGGWRFVTDFTQLNNYIRKTPAISSGIEETKLQIASFKFMTCIDLSQFYFQNRMDRGSIQYLGVIHPYRGTLVYTVSPMGLRNSSEIAYERLTRIFGRKSVNSADRQTL